MMRFFAGNHPEFDLNLSPEEKQKHISNFKNMAHEAAQLAEALEKGEMPSVIGWFAQLSGSYTGGVEFSKIIAEKIQASGMQGVVMVQVSRGDSTEKDILDATELTDKKSEVN